VISSLLDIRNNCDTPLSHSYLFNISVFVFDLTKAHTHTHTHTYVEGLSWHYLRQTIACGVIRRKKLITTRPHIIYKQVLFSLAIIEKVFTTSLKSLRPTHVTLNMPLCARARVCVCVRARACVCVRARACVRALCNDAVNI
jgi:hypothetical protein